MKYAQDRIYTTRLIIDSLLMSQIQPVDKNRVEIRNLLCTHMTNPTTYDAPALAIRLEKSVFNSTIRDCDDAFIVKRFTNPQFLTIYSSYVYKILSILHKLTPSINNPLASTLDFDTVCDLSIIEVDPDAYRCELDNINLRLSQKVEERYSNRYTCPKCKKKMIIADERQTRAGDELSTWFKKCDNPSCGFRFT